MPDTPDSLAAALRQAARQAPRAVEQVVSKGALNVKNQARQNVLATAPTQNAHAHRAITYDTEMRGGLISAEIGYDKSIRGGALGNILEYGSEHNPPHRDLGRALDNEEPNMARFIAAAVERLL